MKSTTQQLRERSASGNYVVVPVVGQSVDSEGNRIACKFNPRRKGDPYPWTMGDVRYRSSELELLDVRPTDEPSLEDYAAYSRAIQALIPQGRNAARES